MMFPQEGMRNLSRFSRILQRASEQHLRSRVILLALRARLTPSLPALISKVTTNPLSPRTTNPPPKTFHRRKNDGTYELVGIRMALKLCVPLDMQHAVPDANPSVDWKNPPDLSSVCFEQVLQMKAIAWVFFDHTDLSDNTVNEPCRGDIKRGIPYIDAFCCDLDGLNVKSVYLVPSVARPFDHGHFVLRPLFNNDILSRPRTNVDCRLRRRYQELYSMILGKNSKPVCSNLIGRVTICSNTICSHDNGSNPLICLPSC